MAATPLPRTFYEIFCPSSVLHSRGHRHRLMSVRAELAKSLGHRQKRLKGRLKRTLNLGGNSRDLAIYAQMREDNLRAAEFYSPGRFWSEINSEFADFLWAGALPALRTEYLNRRFAGPDPCSRQVWRALLWV